MVISETGDNTITKKDSCACPKKRSFPKSSLFPILIIVRHFFASFCNNFLYIQLAFVFHLLGDF